jgi:hypothetical protein
MAFQKILIHKFAVPVLCDEMHINKKWRQLRWESLSNPVGVGHGLELTNIALLVH